MDIYKRINNIFESPVNEGTHARVGVVGSRGKITSINVWYDGYPEHTLKYLQKYYNTPEKAQALMSLGNVRALESNIKKTAKGASGDPAEVSRNYSEFDIVAGDEGTEYSYLFKRNNWVKAFDALES